MMPEDTALARASLVLIGVETHNKTIDTRALGIGNSDLKKSICT